MTAWKEITGPGPMPPWRILMLDRDGVVIQDRGYIGDPDQVALLPGAAAAMARAQAAGWFLLGVSNQSGLARGLFSPEDFQAVMTRVDTLLSAAGVAFDGFLYCPHGPDDGCSCRKPSTGLLAEAGLVSGIDRRSWMVGDKVSDVELARNLGAQAILVRSGYGARSEEIVRRRWPDDPGIQVVADLAEGVDLILGEKGPGEGGAG